MKRRTAKTSHFLSVVASGWSGVGARCEELDNKKRMLVLMMLTNDKSKGEIGGPSEARGLLCVVAGQAVRRNQQDGDSNIVLLLRRRKKRMIMRSLKKAQRKLEDAVVARPRLSLRFSLYSEK